jgi:hypothetical protein
MLQWDEMAPYNAVHVVQLPGRLDLPRLHEAIDHTLHRRGLGPLSVDRRRFAYRYASGPAEITLDLLEAGHGTVPAMVSRIEAEINRRFDWSRPFCPFRFFAAPEDESFYLGIVYFHPVADAESIVELLKEIAHAFQGLTPAGQVGEAPDLYPDSRAHLLTRHGGVLLRKLLSLRGQIRAMRRSHRARLRDPGDLTNGFVFFSLDAPEWQAAVTAAKQWGVTINDLFLALLLKALSPCAPGRVQSRKRPRLAIGCIVNLRKDLGIEAARAFGTFLGSFHVTHPVPEGIALRELARAVQRQTEVIKRDRLFLASALELAFGRFLLNFFSPPRRRKFYSKYYPLMGGITNMNVNRLWQTAGSAAPRDYFRGVSTGPITPLALSLTTLGDRGSVGLSYRTTVFSRAEVEALGERLRAELKEVVSAC